MFEVNWNVVIVLGVTLAYFIYVLISNALGR